MESVFENAKISHVSVRSHSHQAAFEILTTEGFETAFGEITQLDGHAPTPLYSLKTLAERLSLGEVLYKDEGSRFRLGNFKAFDGAYSALRVLHKNISINLSHDVSFKDIRTGKFAQEAADITLVSAIDGKHGCSLA